MSEREPLVMWVIYDNPADKPGMFVGRMWIIDGKSEAGTPTDEYRYGLTLEAVRDALPADLYRMPRQEGDDPVIVEIWF